ncbi:MAG: phosphodiester glycosidase family protein [Lentisphaeria bacterium]|nr:phosphodiester glycosidase family protein [Lentisphaeria bacterium]
MKRVIAVLLSVMTAVCWAGKLPLTGVMDWSKVANEAPGIKVKSFKLNKPRKLSIHAVQVDLSNPKIYLVVNSKPEEWNEFMPYPKDRKIETKRMRVWDFVLAKRREGHNVRLAVNASPWGPWGDPKVKHLFANGVGLLVSNGEVLATPHGKKAKGVPALIVRNNGSADLITFKQGDDPKGIKLAVSGFSFILVDGKVTQNDKPLHPRTFYGLSKDKKTLYIGVVDGRQADLSLGMTCGEGGELMQYLGAFNAVNMDGGGSTTLVTCKGGKNKLVNSPSDAKNAKKDKFKSTRHVATALGVCVGKQKPQKKAKSGK